MNQAVTVKSTRKLPKVVWAAPLVVALIGMGGYAFLQRGSAADTGEFTYQKASARPLDVTIKKDGELQAVNNIDIMCEVEGSTAITMIVKEGASVKKGDVLVQLDSSIIRQKIDDATLEVQKADADLITAREFLEIQKSQNDANLELAHSAQVGAEIDLEKYKEGDYPQALITAQTKVTMAEIDLKNMEADFGQVQDLAAKQFLTATDVESRRVALVKARNDLATLKTDLKNLESYEKRKQFSFFETALSQAKQKLIRTERENRANLAQKEADLGAKTQSLDLIRRKLQHLKDQLAACTISAPEDGLVVYATSQDRNAQQAIQEGATVRERQMILRLPDTAKMKAVVRIQEAQVTKLREGMRAMVNVVGLAKPLMGTVTKISVLADSGQRFWNPDLKEYPVDVELDDTPAGIKPGIGLTCEIMVARVENSVNIPINTVYSSGSKSYVFIKPVAQNASPAPRAVTLGLSNDTDVQVVEGVAAHESVLVLQAGQGRALLLKAGIQDEAATRPSFKGKRRGGGGGGGGGGGEGGPGVAGGARPGGSVVDGAVPASATTKPAAVGAAGGN